ncbi:GGDEF/EAL domain-containing response regulator [Oceanospirillum sanctuarii]|uniref:GGDEF/EAL domain-containing response regulator n=1 Tax=Oceanospirillum sanctuarii TaxID=1434821 RepID=UPI000A37C312|nr:EAL domain-containing protein [Oceanospirillum sanctuarii]
MDSQSSLNTEADILILDDNEVNVDLLASLLEDEGFTQVECMTDPRQLMPRVAQKQPDLIFLDIRMPHISGLELLEQLRESLGDNLPAVIILTANTDQTTRYQALELGARDFLTKPFDNQEVLRRLENILQEHLRLQQQMFRADELESLVAERTCELKRMAVEDPLTGLPNRTGLLSQLQEQIEKDQKLLIYFFAVDGLDEMARLHGLEVAENLALALKDRALKHRQEGDILGLWSSTEWVLARRTQIEGQPSCDQLADRVLPLLGTVRQPIDYQEFRLRLNARAGISTSDQSRSAENLIRLAALAVPETPNSWRDYTPELESQLQRKLTLQEALNHAAERGELELYFQPKISLPNEECLSAEALLRWSHPTLGRISPVEFIPLAEKTGQILDIGHWVLDASCRQLKQWRDQQQVPENFMLAVNVASQQLTQQDFARTCLKILNQYELPASVLEIEVTESGLMDDMAEALLQLRQLADAGISIAIDDFGTGYSSMAYLKDMPVSVLKIDRAFIKDMHENTKDKKLVETVMQLCENFGFITVAEGVENEEQLEILKQLNCELIQGYYYSPPLTGKALLQYVSAINA